MTHKELHLRNFLVDIFHELDDKVDEFVLEHLIGVEVCYQEGNVITLGQVSLSVSATRGLGCQP